MELSCSYSDKHQTRDEASNVKAWDVIMCCLVKDIPTSQGAGLMSMEQWSDDKQGETKEIRRYATLSAIPFTTNLI
jgi:hypothetical protein